MSNLDKISSVFNAKIDTVKTKDDLQNIKTEFFGKNGQITQQFKNLGSLDPEKRKEFASNLNRIKDDLANQLEQKNLEIEISEINEKLKNEKVDINLLALNKFFSSILILILGRKSLIAATALERGVFPALSPIPLIVKCNPSHPALTASIEFPTLRS